MDTRLTSDTATQEPSPFALKQNDFPIGGACLDVDEHTLTTSPVDRTDLQGVLSNALPAKSSVGIKQVSTIAGLLILVACTGLIAVSGASGNESLVPSATVQRPDWLLGPFHYFNLNIHINLTLLPILLAVMFLGYLLVLFGGAQLTRLVIVGIVFIHVILLLSPPLLSADVFSYIDLGRMGVIHKLNPYIYPSGTIKSDPGYPFQGWHSYSSPYGGVFILLSYTVAKLGVAFAFWLFKLLTVGCSLACLWLVHLCATKLKRQSLPAVTFVAYNPIWVVFAVGGTHNDLLLMLLMLTGVVILLGSKREHLAGGTIALASFGVKLSAGILVPFMFITSHNRKLFMFGVVTAVISVLVITVGFFGIHGLNFIDILDHQQQRVAQLSIPNKLGNLLGFDGVTTTVRTFSLVGFLTVFALMLWRTKNGIDWLVCAGWSALALLLASAWLLPWYIVWVLPLAALGSSNRLKVAVLLFTLYLILIRIPG